MGCFGKNRGRIDEHAKWDYINLDDFHPTSSWTPLSYLWVWIYGIIGVAVFAADCFTAVNLLILDKWASQIKPAIDLTISKWIFVGCIMFSFALYIFEWARAIRVMRRGGIAESYMDPLAVQVQCMRSKGWKRFLVFASLTKSKKGTDYIAFFVYFQFNSVLRIIFAEGGRQFVNAVTLISVAKADLVPIGAHAGKSGSSPVLQFFVNIVALWNDGREQAIVLASMVFTLVIWVFSAISLIAALIMYLVFLWHYVPQSDGRLSIYCRRKIDRRLEKIVEKKVQAALEDDERKRQKQEARAANGKKGPVVAVKPVRQPTLPNMGNFDEEKAGGFGLERTDSASTLPPYTSRPGTRNDLPGAGLARQPTLPGIQSSNIIPPRPMRQNTGMSGFSNHSYASNAPLLQNSGDMGFMDGHDSRPQSPWEDRPAMGRQGSSGSLASRPPPARTMTNSSMGTQRSHGGPMPGAYPPPRSNTAFSTNDRSPLSRAGSSMDGPGYGPPRRANTNEDWTIPEQPSREITPTSSVYSQRPSQQRQVSRQSFNRPFLNESRPQFDTRSPPILEVSTSMPSLTPSNSSPASAGSNTSPGNGYVAFNPYNRSPSVPAAAHASALRRNMTNPVEMQPLSTSAQMQARSMGRSYTAPIDR